MRLPLLAAALLACAPGALRAQSATVADLAQVLALEDRREFDGGALRRAAQHPDPLVRRWSARAIGQIGDRAGTPLLLELLADPDTSVRAEAAFALGQLRDPAAVPELVRRVSAFDPVTGDDAGLEIVTALAKIGGAEAAQALDGLLRAHPPTVTSGDLAAPRALLEAWRLGRLAPAQRLVAYVRDGQGSWRRAAVYSAGRLRLPAAAASLLDATQDDDQLTRQWAARALTADLADSAGMARAAFTARLRQLADDDDPQVRINALRALATFADSSLAPTAAARLLDRDPNVTVQAAATLGALGGSRAVALLTERAAQGGTFALRRTALEGLAVADGAGAVTAGRPWATDADWRVRATYAEVLGIAATDSARAALMPLASDADGRVAAAALAALQRVVPAGDAALRSRARSALANPDVMVRAAAIDLLGREHDLALLPDLVGAYRAAARDPMADARLAAVQALADLAAISAEARQRVERDFLAAVGPSPDYLVRRAVAERFGADVRQRYWGPDGPIATGRSPQDYQSLISRYVLPPAGTPAPTATIETERGTIVVTLFGADAPITVDNFLRLADRHYFDNTRWHRVVPNFVIQGGDPRGDGNGGPGYAIRDEINPWRYDRGTLGMALSGPDTGGSQFFLTHSPQPHLDGRYTVFGRLTSGADVLDRIVQGDRIRRVTR